MLEIRNLHARIADEGTEIIRGLNLTVAKGEVAAIMGPNGSGKSTLSYILAGREDYEACYVPDAARAVLKRFEDRSAHYELLEARTY